MPATSTWAAATAVTTSYLLQENIPYRFLKLVLSANTNVTLTVDAFL